MHTRLPSRTVVGLAVAACATAVATGALAAVTANSLTVTDAADDAGPAPDITGVSVSSDDQGLIRIRVEIPNRPALLEDDDVVLVIDADDDATTGDEYGWDFDVNVDATGAQLVRFDGGDAFRVPLGRRSSYQYARNGFDLVLGREDLGLTPGFEFYAASRSGDGAPQELAPNGDDTYWFPMRLPFELFVSPLRSGFDLPDQVARAGRSWSLALRAVRADTGMPLSEGTVRCSGRLGKKALPQRTGRFFRILVSGKGDRTTAMCGGWTLPKAARGKQLRATITVSHGGKSLSRTVSTRVR
ncbi:MAG TPA: hypothetical protein VLB86_08310 [Gaiellaceae bacterium]|nr:hypothetical protein [Gaiellaceae bacterium]